MHLRRLAEIAALTALQAHHVIDADEPVAEDSLHRSVHHAKDLQRLWRQGLDAASNDAVLGETDASLSRLMAEVFVSEMLLRVWTAVLTASDASRAPGHAGPLGRHMLLGLWEVRLRVLRLIVDSSQQPVGSLYQIDRLRRRSERWCDLLVGQLAAEHDVLEFAFDPRRAAEHARELGGRGAPWPLVAAGIQAGFPADPVADDRNEAHRGVANAILSAFPATSFDQSGQFASRDLHRLRTLPPDARLSASGLTRSPGSQSTHEPSQWRTPIGIQFRKLFPRRDG